MPANHLELTAGRRILYITCQLPAGSTGPSLYIHLQWLWKLLYCTYFVWYGVQHTERFTALHIHRTILKRWFSNEIGDLSVSSRELLKWDRLFCPPITPLNGHYRDGWFFSAQC